MINIMDEVLAYKCRIEKARVTVIDLESTVDMLQKICVHDFEYQGHNHNYSIYWCKLCDKREER